MASGASSHPAATQRRSANALPDGARLAEFEIRGVVGEGGFGIVYLAWDHSLQRQVAIKEYMPATLASRTLTTRVAPRSEKSADTFALGLRSFINEAQLLASFDHPSLLKVHRFWEGNGTAYMVMPYYQGVTLKRALAALPAPPEEIWLLRQVGQLLDALEVMHNAHCYHRDIAPDNILLLDDARPLLLDFGAARRVIGDATQALTAFLKPGYAPVEQYAEMPSMKQGPWTDLYALGSVVHCAITGHTPPESVARLLSDTMVPLVQAGAGRYGEPFLRSIDHALAVRPQDRPQEVAQMRRELGIEEGRARAAKTGVIPTAPLPLDGASGGADATQPPPQWTQPATKSPTAPTLVVAPPQRPAATRWQPLITGLLWGAAPLLVLLSLGVWWSVRPSPPPPAQAATGSVRGEPLADPAASMPAAASTLQPGTDSAIAEPTGSPAEPATQAAPPRPIPRKNSQSPRCTEIIARVSLGEELSADDRATLQKECRK